MKSIHDLAIVEQGALLGEQVQIGPFCSIGSEVVIQDRVKIHEHVVIKGRTTIATGTEIYPYAAIGLPPQDLKYNGEKTQTIIGKNCQIREHVTIHAGTNFGDKLTKIGDDCLLMVGSHVAHDCSVGNQVIMANNAALSGHVMVDDFCIISGFSGVLQNVRIGKYAMICGMTGVRNDVPPFATVLGRHAKICGINVIGMKRRGFNRAEIREIHTLYQIIFYNHEVDFQSRIDMAKEKISSIYGQELINFLSQRSKKNFCQAGENDENE